MLHNIILKNIETEFVFASSRSSGPGGQNVNKVNTKVELRFHVQNSQFFSELEKFRIQTILKNRINSEGELLIVSQGTRSQLKNKQEAIEKFHQLVAAAIKPRKRRRPTKPTKSSVEKRIKQKKQRGDKKALRKKID
ncbi:MAG: alternative ribosome rescue aminoacyl-tRNA hydrolase ArfB [Prolixibacteraceae bacterium]|jgi:ribosome-associated protein|nr:alternative ribosome rescue aminoacyl-tRNA hydrolase ArfB [Prolixibacteraceae bacterium]